MNALLLVAAILGSGPPPAGPPGKLAMHSLVLAPGRVVMDYLGYAPETNQVWAPGGNTGKVFVVDAGTEAVKAVDGFATLEKDGRLLGPSSVTFGPGTAYVGNRADGSVCAVSLKTLARGACVSLPEPPDGLAYVSTTGEVWATTPRSNSLTILATGEAGLRVAGKIALDGSPEGYAVDAPRGRFFTNLEDRSETLELDVRNRKVVRRWPNGCGKEGPRGLAYETDSKVLVVACTDAIVAFAADEPSRPLDRVETGAGVDNIDLLAKPTRVYVAAGRAESFLRAELTPAHKLTVTGRTGTSKGVRVVVAAASGKAFAADSAGGRLLVISP